MKFSVATYNLYYHQAFAEINNILHVDKPDILCFQEMKKSKKNFNLLKQKGYALAGYSQSFIYGSDVYSNATFYNADKFKVKPVSVSINLPFSYYQIFLSYFLKKHIPRTALKTVFSLPNNKKLIVYNVHLTAFATNGMRLSQITHALADIRTKSKHALILAGDFNFPYRRWKFEALMKAHNLLEATRVIPFTFELNILKLFSIRLKNDYILYRNLKHLQSSRIAVPYSDHFPIVSEFYC